MTDGNCIEVAGLSCELIGVRDSKNPAGPVLGFSRPSGTPSSGMSVTTRSAAGKEDEGRYRLLSGNLPPFNPVGLI